jgi:peptidyl-prolyl cis-trans isomerase C
MTFPFCSAWAVRLGLIAGLIGAAAMPLAAQEPAAPTDPNAVVATVNGRVITEADLALAMLDLRQQFGRLPPEQWRAASLSAMIEIRVLAGKAEADGLGKSVDEDADFQRRVAFLRDRTLHTKLVAAEVDAKISEDDIRARYDQEIAAMPPVNEVHARHILVETKEAAEGIIKELDGGANFEQLANTHTTDPSGKTSGGDLGYFRAGQMVPEFEKAAFALNPGEYTKEPVQSSFGFHIIKSEDKRIVQPPAYEQVKDNVRSLLVQDRYLPLLSGLRAAATVDVADPELKKAIDAEAAASQPKP